MSDMTTWRAQLPALFTTLLGIPCNWAEEPRPLHLRARAQIDVIAMASFGQDDHSTEDSEPVAGVVETIVESVTGERGLTLQVSIWSPSGALGSGAQVFLERLRTRLEMESTEVALEAMHLSFQRAEQPIKVRSSEDGRVVSVWAMDLHLGYVWTETDSENPTSWIETGRITSKLLDADDNEIDSLLDADGEPAPVQVDINPE